MTAEVPVENGRATDENVEVRCTVRDLNGRCVLDLKKSEKIAAGGHVECKLTGLLDNPRRWDPDSPYWYHFTCSLKVGIAIDHSGKVPLGIRTVKWDAENGRFISGGRVACEVCRASGEVTASACPKRRTTFAA